MNKRDIEEDWRLVLAKTGKPKEPGLSSSRRHGGGSGGGSRPTPEAMRASLMAATQRKPQAILKITGFNRSAQGVKAHLSYITRHGEQLTDQDGTDIAPDRINEVGDTLAAGLPGEYRTTRDKRVAMHLMLSMPPGADRAHFDLAVTDFLRAEFGQHEYLYTFHSNTEHYHAHVAIGVQGLDGRRVNRPTRADLGEWREGWAAALERHGIEAMASPALARGAPPKRTRPDIEHMDARGGRSRPPKPSTHDQEAEDRAIEARAGAWRRLGDHYADQGDAEAAAAIREHLAAHFGPTPEARPDPAAELRRAIEARDPAAAAAVLRPLTVAEAREAAAGAGLTVPAEVQTKGQLARSLQPQLERLVKEGAAGGSKTGAKKGEDRDR